MKITKNQFKKIIQEELSAILEEEELSEIAKSPDDPDEGSPNWCKEEAAHYLELLRQAKDQGRKGWLEHEDTLLTQAHNLKTKMQSHPACWTHVENAPTAVQEGTKQMKITKTKLKQIIQEELSAVLGEEQVDCAALQQKLSKAKEGLQQAAMSRSDRNAAGWYGRLIEDLEDEIAEKKCNEAEEAAPTTAKEAGGHTHSSDPGSHQAALASWSSGK